MKKNQVVLITGLSGSGKSTALHSLEDMGFFCIDNFPVKLVPDFAQKSYLAEYPQVAITMDSREKRFLKEFKSIISHFERAADRFDLLFLEANPKSLQRRFSVTRRPHPMMPWGSITEAISQEKKALKSLRDNAHQIIDTSKLSPRALNQILMDYFATQTQKSRLEITLLSFGFHYGTPAEADLVMDVRFIANPHFVAKLQPLTGKHDSVKKYVFKQEETQNFLKKFMSLLRFLIPKYRAEGKSYLTIAIGCTGGQHRSVAITEELYHQLDQAKIHSQVIHRDIGAEG